MPIVLLIDGRLDEKSLYLIKKDNNWFNNQLKKYNIESENDLFLAMIDSRGDFFYQFKNDIKLRGENN